MEALPWYKLWHNHTRRGSCGRYALRTALNFPAIATGAELVFPSKLFGSSAFRLQKVVSQHWLSMPELAGLQCTKVKLFHCCCFAPLFAIAVVPEVARVDLKVSACLALVGGTHTREQLAFRSDVRFPPPEGLFKEVVLRRTTCEIVPCDRGDVLCDPGESDKLVIFHSEPTS